MKKNKKPVNGGGKPETVKATFNIGPEHAIVAGKMKKLMNEQFMPQEQYIPLAMIIIYLQNQLQTDQKTTFNNLASTYQTILKNKNLTMAVLRKLHDESTKPEIWMPGQR